MSPNTKLLLPATFFSLLLVIVTVFNMSTAPLYKGPPSDHFDGRRFFYKDADHTVAGMLKWMWEMETVAWPAWVDDPPQPKPMAQVEEGRLRITYINHATVLIQTDGLNILTDPVWSKRAGPVSWLGTKRVRAPGVSMADLPKIDVILISHDHYDHLDLRTLKELFERDKPQILVGLGVKPLLASDGLSRIVEMDWWQEHVIRPNGAKITFVPARHNSGRYLFGNNRTLWGGFIIAGKGGNIYFAGDTAYDDFLTDIKDRFGKFRLTVLPIGSYEKRWFMKTQHMNPDDAVKAHKLLGSKQSVGMHFGTFKEHPEQTIDAHEQDLSEALEKNRVSESAFRVLKFGEGIDV